MANRFLSLHRAALLMALLPISAQAAGLKSTTEETVKALTASNIPVGDVSNGIYMKTDDNFIAILKSDGRDVQSIEYIAVIQKDRKDLDLHKANASKIMTASLPDADEEFTKNYINDFFANLKKYDNKKLKENFGLNAQYKYEGREVGLITVRYSQKTGAFLFRIDAAQPQNTTPQINSTLPTAKAKALKPKTLDALLTLKGMSLEAHETNKGEYMAQRQDFVFRMLTEGEKVMQMDYAGKVTGKSDLLNAHVLRLKFLLDAFIPGATEDKIIAALGDLAGTFDKQPERQITLGDGIVIHSKYANPGVWTLKAKPE